MAELHFQVLGTEIFFLVVTWISPGVPSAGFTRHKNPSWEIIKWLLADSSRTSRVVAHSSSSELSAHQMAPGEVLPHWRSHRALQLVAWRARIRESGKNDPDLLNDILLVSSVSGLANVGSAKDFSLRCGGSWCAFPAVLPSS